MENPKIKCEKFSLGKRFDRIKRRPVTEIRYRIVSAENGEILDDANGLGYPSEKKAFSSYAYKAKKQNKYPKKRRMRRDIRRMLKQNQGVAYALGHMDSNGTLEEESVRQLLKKNHLSNRFSAKEVKSEWKKMEVNHDSE